MVFSDFKRWHLIGIKGAGMTALAELLIGRGARVTGSDTAEVFYTDAILKRLQVTVMTPFAPANLPTTAEVFVYSTAYTPETNPELKAALESGRPVLTYPEAIGALTQEKMTIAVCGTHGKTTTSALLADVLRAAGVDPSAVIGSEIRSWGGSALVGQGPYFVIEADEYQNKLALYQPLGAILTSVDWDHPDYFPTVAAYEAVFADFLARIPRHGFAVIAGDQARAEFLSRDVAATRYTYGFLPTNMVRAVEYRVVPEAERMDGVLQEFSVEYHGERLGPYRLRLAGRHNVENALAVIAVTLHLKLDRLAVQQGIAAFTGTKRRFEYLGERRGALVYDDYAHHPAEIQATLVAFRDLYPTRRLFVVFHPHTFSRTKALLEEFATSFELADGVVILDIYGSAREVQGGVSARELVDRINHYTPDKAAYAPDRAVLAAEIARDMQPNDVIITMGAGDVWQVAETILAASKTNRKNKTL
ncbi:MAG: UDP-N-acetylmuramate--L-alanine ligase [Candidatus Moraniibacteriota bacterium]|nr:MAG: UDP-N-acetylmuramate--L-alanine ligase [Candidatus Moranbacteria bacterium]